MKCGNLNDLDIHPRIIAVAKKASFVTSSELLSVSVGELSTKTGLSVVEAGRLMRAAALQCTPPYTTGLQLMELNEESKAASHIKTGCAKIDNVLGGGIPCSGITEIAGESGTGKTQMALQLALQCQLPSNLGGLGKGVAYICTEMQFPVTRLNQLINFRRQRGQQTFNGRDFPDNIYVHHLPDMDNLVDCVRYQLTQLATQKGIGLIVLDSVAAVFRASEERQEVKSKMTQQLGYRLHQLSTQQKLTVVAINQVKANFGHGGQGIEDDITPALGLSWANLVTTRIMLRKTSFVFGLPPDLSQETGEDPDQNRQEISSEPQKKIRCLDVIFCPWLPRKSSPFTVTEEGITDVDTSLIRLSD